MRARFEAAGSAGLVVGSGKVVQVSYAVVADLVGKVRRYHEVWGGLAMFEVANTGRLAYDSE
jgi:hypothetical protein